MTLSRIGRISLALVVSVAMGLGMTSCGGGTIGYMWVLGTQYNQIAGFKIDDYTGNLTQSVGSPYPSGGTNPVMLTLKSGGRYLYVLNAGIPAAPATATTPAVAGVAANIALFSVGGDGTLTFQQSYTSQGTNPVYITTDSTGNYLYVLDQQSQDYATTGNGDITVFSLDPNTGRPSLITNAQQKGPTGAQLTYFEVGPHPTQFQYSSNGCIYTLDSPLAPGTTTPVTGGQTIFPYAVSSTNGQLTQTSNSTIALPTANATSVNVGGSYVYVTDAGSALGGPGSIVPYTQGSACSLQTVAGGTVSNLPTASNPIQTITVTGSAGSFLYVVNHSNANTNYANSSISAFTILTNGQLQQVGDTANPYSTGAGPVCIQEDPTKQYLYTSNYDGTVTGKLLSASKGQLSALTRGSSFPAVGQASCMVISSYTGY
jgi:6-phosphogluconolactonase (cycloisomerase 2 family)